MFLEPEVVPQDAELASRVMDEKCITVKSLAAQSHRHETTIYRYLSGEKTFPSDVLRALFELSQDLRIAGLVTGLVPVVYFQAKQEGHKPGCPSAAATRVPPIDEWLPRTCESLESVAKATKYVGQIINDGKFNRDDLKAAENLKRHACDAMRDLSIMVAAVEAEIRKVGV